MGRNNDSTSLCCFCKKIANARKHVFNQNKKCIHDMLCRARIDESDEAITAFLRHRRNFNYLRRRS